MNSRNVFRPAVWLAVGLGFICGLPWSTPTASAQVLFDDEFDGTHGNAAFHPGGVVDVTSFRTPFGVGGDNSNGRTNFSFTLPQDGVSTAASGSTDGKVAVLPLSTYNPDAPGVTFLGSDLISKSNYAVGGGLSMTVRMRIQASTPGGIVAAPFLYDTQRENPPGTLVRDEIDHEILTNNAQTAAPDNTLTNVWNDGNSASPGAPVTINNPPGYDVSQFHDYRVDWTPTSVKWYIDNSLVRTETSVVPDDPMHAHINVWAPDSNFAAAYNAALQPTATSPGTKYNVEVDRMQISRMNTTVSNNLLADGSFENFSSAGPNGTGGWQLFNNASYASGEVTPQDGFNALKVYGPFQGSTNASGAYQNVPASPGQQFEGSVYAYSPSFDSISGTQNYTNITLSFVDAAGNVIGSVNYSPGTNEKNTPIFDGRDTNMVAAQDQWIQYTVDALAPAGTVYARESLFFIQLYPGNVNKGGAVWFDNASLVSLTAQVVAVPGDYNGNGVVDAADYVMWRNNVGQSTLNNRGTGITGPVGQADYDFWRSHFGNTSGSGSALGSAAVPEPCSWVLAMLGVAFAVAKRRRV